MKEHIGKQIEMLIDGTKLNFELVDVQPHEIVAKSKDKIIHIPFIKMGLYSVVDEDVKIAKANKKSINIFMCKNDGIGCNGVKILSLNKDESIDSVRCKFNKNKECEFGKIGNLFDLPDNIQLAFLHGMATQTKPINLTKEKKNGK